jgi:hypothetical protein
MAGTFNLSKDIKVVRVQNAAAAGTTTLVGSTVDTSGFDAALVIYGVGALTTNQVTKLKASSGAASDGSDKSDIAGSATSAMADADGNKLLILDLVRCFYGTTASSTSVPSGTDPSVGYGGGYTTMRYLTPQLVRGTANAAVDFGIVILYNQRKRPLGSQDTTVSQIKTVIDAIQGTA